MTAFMNKRFSVAASSATPRLRPGTRAWDRHVRCDSSRCPKCKTSSYGGVGGITGKRLPKGGA